MFTATFNWAIPALVTIAALVGLTAWAGSSYYRSRKIFHEAASSAAAPVADESAVQTGQQAGAESQGTIPQPPAHPAAPPPEQTATPPEQTGTPTPADPAITDLPAADPPESPSGPPDVLEIPEGANVEIIGSARIPETCDNCECSPWGCQEAAPEYKSCVDSAGREYPDGSVVTIDAYGPGGHPNVFECRDGKWVRIGWGSDPAGDSPLEDPSGDEPEIELDQASLDPPTEVFEAPVSN